MDDEVGVDVEMAEQVEYDARFRIQGSCTRAISPRTSPPESGVVIASAGEAEATHSACEI